MLSFHSFELNLALISTRISIKHEQSATVLIIYCFWFVRSMKCTFQFDHINSFRLFKCCHPFLLFARSFARSCVCECAVDQNRNLFKMNGLALLASRYFTNQVHIFSFMSIPKSLVAIDSHLQQHHMAIYAALHIAAV